ncbi:MAG: PEP-utilizing enzyme [Tepidiformaceae bacterium]
MTTAPTPDAGFELPTASDRQFTWMYDPMHFPQPLPPLSQDIMRSIMTNAFQIETAFAHGYPFMKDFGPPQPTEEVLEKGVLRIWEDEFVPRIAAFCERVRSGDYGSLSAPELASQLPELFREAGEAYRCTMVVVLPFMGPTLALIEFSEQALGPGGPLLVSAMLQGYANETSSAGSGLSELTEFARTLPEVARALQEGRFDSLKTVTGGPQFLERFETFLGDYGWRVDDWALMHHPTWAENAAAPLKLIAAFLKAGERLPGAAIGRSAELRETAEQDVRSRLSGDVLEQLVQMVSVASPHVGISEGRAHWQLTIGGSLRVPVVALGRKLHAAGALANPNDAFFLDLVELKQAAVQPSPATLAVVEERKRELQRAKTLTPPPVLGQPPAMDEAPPEVQSVFKRFFGLGVEPSADAALITGNPASKGVVRGRARVIKDLADADRLEPGDILVCTMTAPPWTPLFAIAGGVVTDTGGVLSHSAICAREYAIPCVVGTMIGTSTIPDGTMITVDGERGTVRFGA